MTPPTPASLNTLLRASLMALLVHALVLHAQVPGIPEPSLILFGTVMEAKTNQAVSLSTVAWQVSDGTVNNNFSAVSLPATRTVASGAESFYVLEVPFDTRTVRTGTSQIALSASAGSMQVKTTSATYTLTATINGQAAKVAVVGGIAQATPKTNYTFNDYTPATQGRMIRVDLLLPSDAYTDWATLFFGSASAAEALRTADPDRDGLTNEEEFNAGTDPTTATSGLRIVNLTRANDGKTMTITWASVARKKYQVETADSLERSAPWTGVGSLVTATTSTASMTIATTPGAEPKFFRVRHIP